MQLYNIICKKKKNCVITNLTPFSPHRLMIVPKGEGAYVSGIWHWIFCPWSSSQCLQRRKVWSNLTSSAIWLHKHADSTESIIFSFSLSVFSITVKGQIRMKKSIYLGHRLISCLRLLVNMSKWISKNIFFFTFNDLTGVWILLQLEKVLSSPEIYDHRASRGEQWIRQHFETRPRLGSSA